MLPRQLNFANVIALVALFIALGSGVWAAQQSGDDNASNREQRKADEWPGQRQSASGKGRVEGAPRGSSAELDELGLPQATGRVNPDGSLDAGARGIRAAKVERVREGTYCLSVRAAVPLITAGLSEEDQAEAAAVVLDRSQVRHKLGRSLSDLGCPRPRRWLVQTRDSSGSLDDAWFYVALFR